MSETSKNDDGAAMEAERAAAEVRSRRVLVACALVIAAALVPTLKFRFLAWDDPNHVTKNPAVQTPTEAPLSSHLLTPQLGYPIPVTVATFTLNRAVFGKRATSFHAVNALLHLGVCALCYAFARRFGLTRPAATTATVLFALHPVVAEPVSWVTGRKDLLAAFFGLLSVWLALSKQRFAYAGSIACYALALLSKPVAAPIAVLCALAPLVRIDVRALAADPAPPALGRTVVKLAPYLAVLIPIAIAGFRGQSEVGAVESGSEGLSRVHSAWYALGHHLSLVFFMEEPTAKYTPAVWPPSPFDLRTTAACLLLVLVVTLGALKMRGHHGRVATFGLVWAALTYLPSSNLLFPITRYLADSFVYLPLVGFAWSFGAAVDAILPHRSITVQRGAAWFPLVLAIALAPPFLVSSHRFHNDAELWSHARKRFKHHPRICRQWANAIASVRGPGPGLEATDLCIQQFGDELFAKNRGVLLIEAGRFAEAKTALLLAKQRKPGDESVQRLLDQVDELLANQPAQH